jgi:hypothetical protein
MANGNPWDHSDILLSNRSGENWGRGIEQVGRAFGQGIQAYYERKEKLEKEEATVNWLNENEQAVNQLFPQLAQVKDPAERKKVIKAGIKGAGLENLVQVKNFTEQQRRAKQQEGIQQEMAGVQLAGARLFNQNQQAQMDERDAEGRAIKAATRPGAGAHEQIMRGVPFGQIDPNAEPDRAELYMREGGRSPQMIQAMTRSRPFSPQEFMTPSGLNMVQTSPNSFIPDPRIRNKPLKDELRKFDIGGRDVFVGPGNKYFDKAGKPISFKTAEGELDPVQRAELSSLPGEISEIENRITAAAKETRKGNTKPGPDWLPGADTYDEKVQKLQTDLENKKRRLKELNSLGGGGADDEEESAPAGARRAAVGDPFSYVLGG